MLRETFLQRKSIMDNICKAFSNGDVVGEPQKSSSKTYTDLILQDFNGNILLLKRSSVDDFQPNKWGLPGGKLEFNENTVNGALRECYEECGLNLKDPSIDEFLSIKPQPLKTYKPEKGIIIYYTYAKLNCLGKDFNLILDQDEHEQYIWIDPEDALDKLNLIPGLVRIIYEIFLEPIYGSRRSQKGSIE